MDERVMGFVARGSLSTYQQLTVPILILKYSGSAVPVVYRSDLSL
jgi:hypothetical protein